VCRFLHSIFVVVFFYFLGRFHFRLCNFQKWIMFLCCSLVSSDFSCSAVVLSLCRSIVLFVNMCILYCSKTLVEKHFPCCISLGSVSSPLFVTLLLSLKLLPVAFSLFYRKVCFFFSNVVWFLGNDGNVFCVPFLYANLIYLVCQATTTFGSVCCCCCCQTATWNTLNITYSLNIHIIIMAFCQKLAHTHTHT